MLGVLTSYMRIPAPNRLARIPTTSRTPATMEIVHTFLFDTGITFFDSTFLTLELGTLRALRAWIPPNPCVVAGLARLPRRGVPQPGTAEPLRELQIRTGSPTSWAARS